MDEAKHFSLLEDAIRRGDSISLIVKLITIYGRQHGKYGTNEETDGERIISLEHLRVLEELTLEKIRQASQEGSLIDTPLLWRVLFFWKENRHEWGKSGNR